MFKGIDDSESVLVFVTQKFMGKVNGMDGANDICKVEFDYALKSCSSKIILVVLEERMKNVSTWKGQLRYVLPTCFSFLFSHYRAFFTFNKFICAIILIICNFDWFFDFKESYSYSYKNLFVCVSHSVDLLHIIINFSENASVTRQQSSTWLNRKMRISSTPIWSFWSML